MINKHALHKKCYENNIIMTTTKTSTAQKRS